MYSIMRRLRERGQGLVELTLALPALIILFLGMIELGFAMRAYLVVVNACREGARFASRGTFTDEQIARQTLVAFSGQLNAHTTGPDANTKIVITRFHIPADPAQDATYDSPVYSTGTLTVTSRISPDLYLVALKQQNDQFNNELVSTHPDAMRSQHDVIFVEVFYAHHQFLHAPILNWVIPEPIILYSRTMIRVGAAREY